MGPYCKFCNNRCFVPWPEGTPQHILDAYHKGNDIIATCSKGQAYEKAKVGYCYDDIIKEITFLSTLKKQPGCECKIIEGVSGTSVLTAKIEYCPKHKAAPDMYEALKECLFITHNVPISITPQSGIIRVSLKAEVPRNEYRRREQDKEQKQWENNNCCHHLGISGSRVYV